MPVMTRRARSTLPAAATLFLAVLAPAAVPEPRPAAADTATTVRFRDRTIDLAPYFLAYPYARPAADLEHGQLFYSEIAEDGKWLRHLPLDAGSQGELDLTRGRRLSSVDWSTRSFWMGEVHAGTGRCFITSDEKNDEHLNVYSIDLATGGISRVTANDYTYGWDFSDDQSHLATIARHGLQEPFTSCLRVRDLERDEEREIFCDGGGADRFTWSRILFSPDQRSVILTVQHDGDRRRTSIARVDLEASDPTFEYLIPPRVLRYDLDLVEGWIGGDAFLYVSAEGGFDNLYRCDLGARTTTRLTDFRDDIGSVELLESAPPAVVVVLDRPHESELVVVDAEDGSVLARELIEAQVSLLDAHGVSGILSLSSLSTPLELEWFTFERTGGSGRLRRARLAGMPAEVAARIVHAGVERVTFPTFDTLPDGSPRLLHAFLLTPKRPPADRERLVRITSFYGGENRFSTDMQIMAEAGIATLTPAPRGSRGFGAEFAALNDGDLGGDEIVDIIHAAKWLERERGYEPEQIGAYGGSHGGYSTMRLLTFPPATNGRGASFDFGFGLSDAGFSDLISFYETCNIPDWVILEAGDPVKEREKLMDRSPINHVELLRAPILLTHGENDWRVPVAGSRKFVERARELGKAVTYVEFEGQGHSVGGLQNEVRYYRAVFEFLESLDRGEASAGGAPAAEVR